MTKLGLTLLFTLLITKLSYAQPQAVEWETFSNSIFEIEYPITWDLDTSEKYGTSFILFSQITDEDDLFSENINLMIEDSEGENISLDQYVEFSERLAQVIVTEGKIIINQRLSKNGIEYHRFIYSGKQGMFNLKFEQYLWVIDNKAYVLTLTCEIDQFDIFQKTGEAILNSFKIK